jgi:hypothetical protein
MSPKPFYEANADEKIQWKIRSGQMNSNTFPRPMLMDIRGIYSPRSLGIDILSGL